MVVEPTQTGINVILLKGENRIGQILDIIVRNRTKQFSWSSDISKLYNNLHLEKSAKPFSLFLYNESLDTNTKPDIYVLISA